MISHNEYYTFQELIEKYPKIVGKYEWTAKRLGQFLAGNVIRGKYSYKEKKNVVLESSFLKLVQYMDDRFEDQKTNYAQH